MALNRQARWYHPTGGDLMEVKMANLAGFNRLIDGAGSN